MRDHLMTFGQLDPKLRIDQGFFDFSFDLDCFVFGHRSNPLKPILQRDEPGPSASDGPGSSVAA